MGSPSHRISIETLYLFPPSKTDLPLDKFCVSPVPLKDLKKAYYVRFNSFILFYYLSLVSAYCMDCLFIVTCLTSSVLTLTAIACDRFMAVIYPLRVVRYDHQSR
jgi:hypothetical protein